MKKHEIYKRQQDNLHTHPYIKHGLINKFQYLDPPPHTHTHTLNNVLLVSCLEVKR